MPIPVSAQEYETITLQDALKANENHSPDIKAAQENLARAETEYDIANANFKPRIRAAANIYNTHIDNSNFNNLADGATTKEVSLDIEQPLYRGGATTAEVARTEHIIHAEEINLTARRQDQFLQTAIAYIDTIRDRNLVRAYQENVGHLTQALQDAYIQKEIGLFTQTDIIRINTEQLESQSDLSTFQRQLGDSETRFNRLTGLGTNLPLKMPKYFTSPASLDDALTTAANESFRVRLAELNASIASERVTENKALRYPQLVAYAGVNKQYDPQPGIIDDSTSATIGLNATIDLYQGGAAQARIKGAQAELHRSRHALNAAQLTAQQIVRQNWHALKNTEKEKAFLRQTLMMQQDILAATREEIKLGAKDVSDLLDVHQDIISRKVAYINAVRNYNFYLFNLLYETGQLDITLP